MIWPVLMFPLAVFGGPVGWYVGYLFYVKALPAKQ